MPHSIKQKLADRLAGNSTLNRKALAINRSLHEVEQLINPPKKENTKKKK